MESFNGGQVEAVAKSLLGEPNHTFSKPNELRYGTRGSLAINLTEGTFFDHEANVGGGLVDLFLRERGGTKSEAHAFLNEFGIKFTPEKTARSRVVARYDYCDENGDLLFQVERLEPKRFRQRCPGPEGKWDYKLNGVRRVLYRLPEMLVFDVNEVVFLVEGEKDADSLSKFGLCATTAPGGANKWREDYSRQLAGRHVTILPDNDTAGAEHARSIATSLAKVCKDVRILELPGLPPKGDVSDRIAAGGTPEELLKLAGDCHPIPRTVAAAGIGSGQTGGGRIGHPEPVPLFREEQAAKPYPNQHLGPLRDAAQAIQTITQAPDAICGQSALAAASLVVQGLVNVETPGGPKPVSLAFLTIAQSGERKSACDGLALASIRKRQRTSLKAYEKAYKLYVSKLEVYEARCKEILRDDIAVEREVDLEALSAPRMPLRPQVLFADVTVEGLARHFDDGTPSIGLFTDEGGMLLGGHAMKSENKLKTSSFLSKLWDGAEFDRVRASGPPKTYSNRRVTMSVMIQPKQAKAFLSDAQIRDQGLIYRFLIAEPKSNIGYRLGSSGAEIADANVALEAFYDRLDQLAELPLAVSDDSDRELEPRILRLDDDARELASRFYRGVEAAQQKNGELEGIRGFASKSTEHAIRLAGVMQVYADENPEWITAETMADAIDLMDWYLWESRRLLDSAPIRDLL